MLLKLSTVCHHKAGRTADPHWPEGCPGGDEDVFGTDSILWSICVRATPYTNVGHCVARRSGTGSGTEDECSDEYDEDDGDLWVDDSRVR